MRAFFEAAARIPAFGAHALIRAYQLSLSSLVGGQCRYLPTCSAYTDEAIARYGLWAGGWMGLSRLCRCHPWGGAGFDPVPASSAADSHWAMPWRYGRWRAPLVCEPVYPIADAPDEPGLISNAEAHKCDKLNGKSAHDRVPGP